MTSSVIYMVFFFWIMMLSWIYFYFKDTHKSEISPKSTYMIPSRSMTTSILKRNPSQSTVVNDDICDFYNWKN